MLTQTWLTDEWCDWRVAVLTQTWLTDECCDWLVAVLTQTWLTDECCDWRVAVLTQTWLTSGVIGVLTGVLGTTTSRTTTRVASLLAHTRIPHFGISATVSGLSDSKLYPTFFRTVPSDLTQSKVSGLTSRVPAIVAHCVCLTQSNMTDPEQYVADPTSLVPVSQFLTVCSCIWKQVDK